MGNTAKRINQDKFNFFVETELTKGTNDKGDNVIFIDGIASSSSVADSDQETLYPTGYNLLPLLETGLINFNHQGSKDANANIGIPLEAKVINDGKDLYFKGMLWDCEQTRGIVRAYENFKKYSPNRKVGYSIEGKATLRGHPDKKHPLFKQILAADVTGMAVTFSPKNKNTLMNIVKGEYSEAFINEDDDQQDNEIVDNNKPKTCPKCDHDQLIKGTCLSCGYVEKAIDTAGLAPAIPELVEHNKKDISNFVSNNIITNFDKELKKSEIFTSICNRYPTATIAQTKEIYSLVEAVTNKYSKMAVTPEALQKAFSLIDEAESLVKSETTESVESTVVNETPVTEEDIEKSMDTVGFMFKAGLAEEAALDIIVKGGIAEPVAKAAWERVVAANQPKEEAVIEKSDVSNDLVKGEIEKALAPVQGEITKVNQVIEKSLAGYGVILQSIKEQNAILIKSNEALALRLEEVEKQPVTGRKSIVGAQAIEKFQKSNEGAAMSTDENTFNVANRDDLSRLSDRITSHLDINYIQKGKAADDFYNCMEGTVNNIEINKTVPAYAFERLAAMGIKLVAPQR